MAELRLRPAKAEDARLVFTWANDPVTRRVSFSSAEIAWDEHLAWFEAQLQRDDRNALIAELDGEALAFVRLDAIAERAGSCTISVNVAPEARGRGVGVQTLEAATVRSAALGFSTIRALIRPDNEASRRTFARAGYLERGETQVNGERASVYLRDTSAATPAADPTSAPSLGSAGVRIKRLFKNTGIYALGEIGLQLLAAFLTPILTLFLLPAEFGLWSLAMMLYTGFMHLCNPALHGAITRFFFDHEHDEEAKQRFQGTILSFLLIWSLGMCVLATVFGDALFDALFDELPFRPYGLLVVWMVFLGVIGVVPKAIWVASERSKSFVGVNLLGSAVNLIGSLALVGLTGLGVLGLFYGRAASLIVLAIPFSIYSLRHVKLAWSWPDLRSALRFSLPLVPHLLAHWVLGMSDRFLIERHYGNMGDMGNTGGTPEPGVSAALGTGEGKVSLGLAAVGIYSAAYVFMDAVNMIAASMNRAWVPQFTRAHGRPEERPFVARSITYFVLAVASMSTALIVLGPTLVRGIFESKYAFAADIAPILAFGGLLQGLYYVYVAVLFFHKDNRLVPIITVVSGTLNVVLNLLWLPKYGLIGAAWATVIGYCVLVVCVRWAALRFEMPQFERGRLARIALVLGPVALTGLAIDGLLNPWLELGVKLALLGVGALALWGLGVFAPRIASSSSGAS